MFVLETLDDNIKKNVSKLARTSGSLWLAYDFETNIKTHIVCLVSFLQSYSLSDTFLHGLQEVNPIWAVFFRGMEIDAEFYSLFFRYLEGPGMCVVNKFWQNRVIFQKERLIFDHVQCSGRRHPLKERISV